MKGLGYRIAAGVVLLLLMTTWTASFYGWGLRSTAVATAQREEIRRRRSVRVGSVYGRNYSGGGPRYGK